MTDSPRSRFRLPHWGWFLLATVVLVVGFVGLSVWLLPNTDQRTEDGSPIIITAVGFILAAFGIWLMVRLVNRGKKPSARLCVCVVLVIAVGAMSVWLPYQREQQAVQKIEGWRGYVVTKTVFPDWLRKVLGQDRMKKLRVFERVVEVDLMKAEVTDARLADLTGLRNLKVFRVHGTKVSDAGLHHLSGLTISRPYASLIPWSPMLVWPA